MNKWTEGVCGDGAAILRDGGAMPIEKILETLNHYEALRAAWNRLPRRVECRLPTHSQCAEKILADDVTDLESFIYDNEPAGLSGAIWRASLADVLSEAIEEDRWSCMPEAVSGRGENGPGRREASATKRVPRSFTVGLARELYDKFVMGGWEPQDSYDLIEELLATQMTDDFDEKADLRAENARLRTALGEIAQASNLARADDPDWVIAVAKDALG